MAPPAPAPAQAQFHRFRLSEFQRSGTPSGSPAGQCSRFRVSDFIPYGSNSGAGADGQQQQQQQQQQPQVNGAAPPAQGPAANSNASPRQTQPRQPQQPAPGTGSYSVLHMDIEASQPQHTSTLVASTGGRGILQKIPMKPPPAQNSLQSPLNGQQPRPIVPAPPPPVSAQHMPSPVVKFDPSQYPEDVRWELARVVGNIQTNPTEFTGLVVNALLTNPSLQDNSLLRHIGALFPQLPPAPPAPPPEADPEKPVKRKRGRPPTKNKPPQVSTGAGSIQPAPAPVNSMGPPVITVIPSRKDKDVMQTCTRCLKPFNPAWRPTPASDPSSEATCAVRHPYPDFQTGLVVSLPTRKRNNYKTTWRWRCCGREVQSQSDEVNVLPRKEDDKTGGWCFVGKHTTEPGVREKFGLKPGKGKMIDEVADITDSTVEGARKKAKLDSGTAATVGMANGSMSTSIAPSPITQLAPIEPPQQIPQQPFQHQPRAWPQNDSFTHNQAQPPPPPPPPQPQPQPQPQPSPMQTEPAAPDEPVKRKRGRPKGSKSKNKTGVATTAAPSISPGGATTSPGSQLLSEASQNHPNNNHLHVSNGTSGSNNFWSQYDSNLPDLADAEHEDDDAPTQHVDSMGMSSVELGMLVSATAAMGGQSSAAVQQQAPAEPTPPAKRGRGRPKGVKNGAGKAAMEKKRLEEEEAARMRQQQHQDHEPQSDPVNAISAGAGGGWFPGDEQGWGGFP